MSTSQYWLAWREILAEVMEGFVAHQNVSPAWLVNPHTGRRLQLDVLFPDVGLALHFVGAQPAARRRRVSDQEEEEAAAREEIRRRICRQHGVVLVTIDLRATDPRRELDKLHVGLSAVARKMARASLSHEQKVSYMDAIAAARRRLQAIRERVRNPEDLLVFADKWRDRETVALRRARTHEQPSTPSPRSYEVGMRVVHPHFGEGVIVDVRAERGEVYLEVDFVTGGKRTLMARLVADKLQPVD